MKAVSRRHTEYRELGRELMTEALLALCQPVIEKRVESGLIQEIIDFAIQRMQITAMAKREIIGAMVQRIYDSVLDKMAEIVSMQMSTTTPEEAS